MRHLPDRVIGPLLSTQGIVILKLESSQVLLLDFHVGMQVSEIEPSATDVFTGATKRNCLQVAFCQFGRTMKRARDGNENLCSVEDEHHLWSFKTAASHDVLKFALIPHS